MVSAAAVAALTLSGCTSSSHHGGSAPSHHATATALATPESLPATVKHLVPPAGTQVLTTLDSRMGTVAVGTWPVTKKFAEVYVTCVGPGDIKINVSEVGIYPLVCDQTGAGSLNTFQVDDQKTFTVTIDSPPSQKWAVTVAQSDTDN